MQKASRLLTSPGGVPPILRSASSTSSPYICSNCAERLSGAWPASSLQRPSPRRPLKAREPSHRRHYASEAPSSSSTSLEPSSSPPDLSWPTPNPKNPYEIPSPYAIFRMSPSDPYSKRRFYELVKLYHPDTYRKNSASLASSSSSTPSSPSSSSSSSLSTENNLSPSAALHRYRMVIAANELLSSPRRRRLYDQHGLGWSGRPEFGPTPPSWDFDPNTNPSRNKWTGFSDNAAKSGADPRANATWEDWEEWQMRQQRTNGEQRPVYVSNGTFVVLLCVGIGVAVTVEGQRTGVESRTMLEQVEMRHARNSRDLMRRREESRVGDGNGIGNGAAEVGGQGYWSRDDRLRRFLRVRGPVDGELERTPVGGEREGSVFVEEGHEGGQSRKS